MNDGDLRELMDRQAIGDVLKRYCVLLDRMQLDELATLFTADCSVTYGEDPLLRSEGAAALAESLQRMWRWKRTAHHLTNVLIDFDGKDAARATSCVMAWHERPNGTTATVFGQYEDSLSRNDDRWRIATRRMTMTGSDAGFTLDLFPATRQPPPPGWAPPKFSTEE